jgi:hypothetical protein
MDHIRLYLREKGWEVVDWIHLSQDRGQWRALANTLLTSDSIKGEKFLD